MVAVAFRDTRALALSDAQCLSHFPASPLVCLSWYQGIEPGLVERREGRTGWHPFGTSVTLSGSQSRPIVSWAPTTGRGGIACFTPDAARLLFGIDPSAVQDRFVCARALLGPAWQGWLDALSATPDDAAALALLERGLGPRWRAQRGGSAATVLRQAGRHWVERLAWQARQWRLTHGARQVERRVKAYSGRSLREWQAIVRTEELFFSARDRLDAGQPFEWADMAAEAGFADQAHLSRATKRITGFAPAEFTRRYLEDESFWIYRLWV